MADFDPYFKWLGIRPKDQPLHHYRLLGIDLFESDPDVVDTAANKQMAYLHTCATGEHAALAERLLNEISEARLCLLDPKKKTDYDARLKEKVGKAKPKPPLAKKSSDPAPASTKEFEFQDRVSTVKTRKKQGFILPLAIGGIVVVAIGIVGIVFMNRDSVSNADNQQNVKGNNKSKKADQKQLPKAKENNPKHPTPKGKNLPNETKSKSKPKKATKKKAKPPVQKAHEVKVDFLKLIDLKKNAVAGNWKFNDNALISLPTKKDLYLHIPYSFPTEFVLNIKLQRTHGRPGWNGPVIGWLSEGSEGYVVVDGGEASGPSSGLGNIRKKNVRKNETTRKGLFLKEKVPNQITCTVTQQGVHVAVNGKMIIDWKGDLDELSLPLVWKKNLKHGVFFRGYASAFRITELELIPIQESSGP